MNGNNGSMLTGDHSSATIIGAMQSYVDDDHENKASINNQVSSLPTSSTTSTISTSTGASTFTPTTGNDVGDDVCRDYLRNVCRRGKNCRFKHPDTTEPDMMMNPGSGGGGNSSNNNRGGSKDNFVFCHDYQNRECRRENCRFLHCSKQEEEIFRATGKLPAHASGQAAALSSGGDGKDPSTPICKDFVNGICRRGPGRCKFRHPTTNESYHQAPSPTNSRNSFDGRNGGGPRGSNFAMCSTNSPHNMDAYGYGRPPAPAANMAIASSYGYDQYAENPNKRKRFESMYTSPPNPYGASSYQDPMQSQVHGGYGIHASSYYGQRAQLEGRSYLEEENAALRRRIDDLKKQVTELMTTNEYLMDQINQMRGQSVGPGGSAAVAVATATSVASLLPPQSTATAMGISTISAGQLTQSLSLQPVSVVGAVPPPPPPGTTVMATPVGIAHSLAPSSMVSSIASISLPTVSAPVNMVNSSGASLVFTPSMVHSQIQNAWPLGVDQ